MNSAMEEGVGKTTRWRKARARSDAQGSVQSGDLVSGKSYMARYPEKDRLSFIMEVGGLTQNLGFDRVVEGFPVETTWHFVCAEEITFPMLTLGTWKRVQG
jgi:hypothetical protein